MCVCVFVLISHFSLSIPIIFPIQKKYRLITNSSWENMSLLLIHVERICLNAIKRLHSEWAQLNDGLRGVGEVLPKEIEEFHSGLLIETGIIEWANLKCFIPLNTHASHVIYHNHCEQQQKRNKNKNNNYTCKLLMLLNKKPSFNWQKNNNGTMIGNSRTQNANIYAISLPPHREFNFSELHSKFTIARGFSSLFLSLPSSLFQSYTNTHAKFCQRDHIFFVHILHFNAHFRLEFSLSWRRTCMYHIHI